MPLRPSRELERGASADLWRHTLSQIPTVFGRLVYLSSLRNQNDSRYHHHGLGLMFGDEESHRTLAESHDRAFSEWLNFNLEEQKADLDLYLSTLSTNKRTLVETWVRLAPYRNFVPATVRHAERQLYLSDLETILELIRNACGVSGSDPDA